MNEAQIPLEAGNQSQSPSRIVIHAMAEFIDTEPDDYSAVEWLRKLGLSAHAFVTPSGVVIRSRRDDQGGYHAKGFNTGSLGVEFLVGGLHTYPTFLNALKKKYLSTAQYNAGVELVKGWREKHSIKEIDRHSDLSPGRKVDPGKGFPWEQFLKDTGFDSPRRDLVA